MFTFYGLRIVYENVQLTFAATKKRNYLQTTVYTVKIKCAYHTNGVLYGTVGVLITLLLG